VPIRQEISNGNLKKAIFNKQMKKLGIVITDGVGFRNFMLSDFMDEASKQYRNR